MISPVLGSSFMGYDGSTDLFLLYDAHFNLIRSGIKVYNCIPMTDLAFVRIEDRIGYMYEKGELIWSRPATDTKKLRIELMGSHLFHTSYPNYDGGYWN